jgi:hypothetical protein
MVRSFWLAFIADQVTRYALRLDADKLNEALLGQPITTVEGWRIQGVSHQREWYGEEVWNGRTYTALGGEFKIVASRAP